MKILHIVGGSPNSGAYKGAEILHKPKHHKTEMTFGKLGTALCYHADTVHVYIKWLCVIVIMLLFYL